MTIRVVIIEDSPVILRAIHELCAEDREVEIVGTASLGREGVGKVSSLRPNLVILDIGLPDIDGFEVVERVMDKTPTPILILTASLTPSWRRPAFDALTLGAVDVMAKPTGRELRDPGWRRGFLDQIKLIAQAPAIPHVLTAVRAARRRASSSGRTGHEDIGLLVVVGSSGSPRSVSTLLGELRPAFPLPIPVVVALHLGEGMGAPFAQHLENLLSCRVVELGRVETLKAGVIYVVPGRMHAEFCARSVVRTSEALPGAMHAPSLDRLLLSVRHTHGGEATAVILSGMGSDGAEGLLALRQAGARTFGQNQQSSVVYGMPRAAMELGAVELEDTPTAIGQMLLRRIERVRLGGGTRSGN